MKKNKQADESSNKCSLDSDASEKTLPPEQQRDAPARLEPVSAEDMFAFPVYGNDNETRKAMEMLGDHIGLDVRGAPLSVVRSFACVLAALHETDAPDPIRVLSAFLFGFASRGRESPDILH